MTDGGKGSTPRPIPDRQAYEANWDRIFGVKDGLRSVHEAQGSDQAGSTEAEGGTTE